MTNGEMFKEVFGYDLYCKECRDGWRNYEYKGSVHYHFDPEKGRYINDNPPFIPLSVIEDIKAELECRMNEIKEVDEKSKTISMKGYVLGLGRALEIIDEAVKEIEHG